jgi:hypothetical protein
MVLKWGQTLDRNDRERSSACRRSPRVETRTLRQQRVSVREAIGEAQHLPLDTGQKCLEPRAPLFEWPIARVEALQFQQVEAVDAHWHTPGMQQGQEIGLALCAGGN